MAFISHWQILDYLYRSYICNSNILYAPNFELTEFLISNGTILYTSEAKYLSEFRPNFLVFTQWLAKSLCDLKLQLIFLVWEMSYIVLFERFPLTLNNSIASAMFLWWILNDLSPLTECSKELTLSL